MPQRSLLWQAGLLALAMGASLAAAEVPDDGAAEGPTTRRTELPDGRVRVSGLVTPDGDRSFTLRNLDGRTTVRWSDPTQVALDVNYHQLEDLRDGAVRFQILREGGEVKIPLPAGPKYARKAVQPRQAAAALAEARKQRWLSARGVAIQCPPLADHLPTEAEPFFAGRWTFGQGRGKPAALAIGGETFEVSMKTGGQTNVLVYGALAPADIRPFVYRAAVVGKEARGALVADEVHLEPVGDQAASDNPSLPRYLCIGDSISYNYAKALREALAGKANVHHPPTNCGPSGKGVGNIVEWLGAWEVKGRHWDVISFNFGHWDAGGTKEKYQANLEIVIREMKKTGAKLIWVTTCPVPEGCKPAGDLDANGKAPGRTAGVMKKYLNPWALEVMKRHPEIAVCDLWQFVADHRGDLYAEWWKGNNVHFSGEGADALGTVLARRVLEALGRKP